MTLLLNVLTGLWIFDLNCGTETTNADSTSMILGKGFITSYMSDKYLGFVSHLFLLLSY